MEMDMKTSIGMEHNDYAVLKLHFRPKNIANCLVCSYKGVIFAYVYDFEYMCIGRAERPNFRPNFIKYEDFVKYYESLEKIDDIEQKVLKNDISDIKRFVYGTVDFKAKVDESRIDVMVWAFLSGEFDLNMPIIACAQLITPVLYRASLSAQFDDFNYKIWKTYYIYKIANQMRIKFNAKFPYYLNVMIVHGADVNFVDDIEPFQSSDKAFAFIKTHQDTELDKQSSILQEQLILSNFSIVSLHEYSDEAIKVDFKPSIKILHENGIVHGNIKKSIVGEYIGFFDDCFLDKRHKVGPNPIIFFAEQCARMAKILGHTVDDDNFDKSFEELKGWEMNLLDNLII
jgi:hypothetical protein